MSKGCRRRPTNEAAYSRGWERLWGARRTRARKGQMVGHSEAARVTVDSLLTDTHPCPWCGDAPECDRVCEVGDE